jgi:hypothetical protein
MGRDASGPQLVEPGFDREEAVEEERPYPFGKAGAGGSEQASSVSPNMVFKRV